MDLNIDFVVIFGFMVDKIAGFVEAK